MWEREAVASVRPTRRRGRGLLRNIITRFAVVAVAATVVSGCAIFEGEVFSTDFWSSSPLMKNDAAEMGIAELAKGNYAEAESHLKRALGANDKDVHALLALAMLYQSTGQTEKARQLYQSVLAIRPDASQQFVVWNSVETKPATEIASVNLAMMDSGGAPKAMAAASGGAGAAPVGGAPTSNVMLGRAAAPSPVEVSSLGTNRMTPPAGASVMTPDVTGGVGSFAGGDANVISRFTTLRALRDQGLVTEDEFQRRRRASMGALLPLTSPPPAAGLDRPVPTTDQISGRLQAIGRALEMRAISVAQHGAERTMILDALLPAAPVVIANPKPAPGGLMEAADMVRRLEQLRASGYITADEYSRERTAIELAMRPQTPQPTAAEPAKMAKEKPAMAMAKGKASGPAVHLASYRSIKQAERGWAQIRRAHAKLLGGMQHEVSKVTLGKKRTYFRLKVGPLADNAKAKALCQSLKTRRQFCEPSTMGG